METKPNLYESLLGYAVDRLPSGISGAAIGRADRFIGRLAESWSVSDDGLRVEMTLRSGVRSVAGKELDAEDVLYTIQRGFHVPGYYKWTAQVAGLMSDDDVEAVDSRTVRFRLTTPSAFFLDTRVFPMNGIFDADLVRSNAATDDPWSEEFVAQNDAGFGPYTIEEIDPGERLIYRARSDYYRGRPAFDQVVYRVIPDAAERQARLASGELDYAQGLTAVQLRELSAEPKVQVAYGVSPSVFELALRCNATPFADVRLRRAVAYAMPYEAILRDVLLGRAQAWRGLIPTPIDGYDESLWPYRTDVDRARAELAAAAPPADFEVKILGSAGVANHRPTGELIVEALRSIGLPASLEIADPADFSARRAAGDYVALICEAGPMVPDAGYHLSHDFCSVSEGNDFGYANPLVDVLVNRGLGEIEREKRQAMYREAQKLLIADVPVVPLACLGFALAFSRRLAGVAWYPDMALHFAELSPAV